MSDMNDHGQNRGYDHGQNRGYAPVPDTYALTGKIMLSAIVVLFTVVIFIICLHIYARWYIARRQRQHQQYLRERRRRRAHIVFVTDLSSSADTLSQGLEASLLNSLPTFVYTSATQKQVLECAVCLSEFEENEKGRLLPKCNHSFHIGCIDMWFHSHSTCPLCRSPVTKPEFQEPAQTETVINLDNSRPDGQQETSSPCSSSGNTSLGSRRKAFDITGVSIDVPRRTEEMVQGSPAGVFKSPGARLLSFKMRLGRDRRHSSASISCSSAMEIDLERGEIEEEHVHVPRPSEHQQSSTTN